MEDRGAFYSKHILDLPTRVASSQPGFGGTGWLDADDTVFGRPALNVNNFRNKSYL
jgi:hypothetical protein